MARRIIQIACCTGEGEGACETIYALCNDGTLWNGVWGILPDAVKWREIDAPFTKEVGGNVPPTAQRVKCSGPSISEMREMGVEP